MRQGSVVWVEVKPDRGATKPRPVVIVTATEEIVFDRVILGVAVTTTVQEPPPDNCVELPWTHRGHPATGFRRRCAAVCDWLVELRPSEVTEVSGYVPTKVMSRILETYRRLSG